MEQLVARRAHNPKVVGSSPTPATNYGGCGEVVNTPDCGSGIRGFDPLQSPHIRNVTHRTFNLRHPLG